MNAMRRKDSYLFLEEHIPRKSRFPAIDAHNHLWGDWSRVDEVVRVMDETGVLSYCDLTANMHVDWVEGGYRFGKKSYDEFLKNCSERFPGRFYGFTAATFTRPADEPLFEDAGEFVERTIRILNEHVSQGARGLKILKELGLHYRDSRGNLVEIDDERLSPVWEEAGRLGVPVLVHHSDPYGFFQPVTEENEHSNSLKKYPNWDFSGSRFPGKEELLKKRDRLLENHPDTVFLLAHVANFAENLSYVDDLLEGHPNANIDFSARIDELGRQPYSARDFFIRHQDRIVFGTDMPASPEMYRCYFRFLETYDEHFIPPDYDGTFGRHRWRICGLGLPDEVLKKIYYENALTLIPGLREELNQTGLV